MIGQMIDWDIIDRQKFADEEKLLSLLTDMSRLEPTERTRINRTAIGLVKKARKMAVRKGVMESFLEEFGLSNKEGLALMCLAESLLRVPDSETADRLIAEKIASGDWGEHKGQSDNWLVNASTWGLMLTGNLVRIDKKTRTNPAKFIKSLTKKAGEPVIRAAMMQAMRIMGEQFVLGRNIEEAVSRAKKLTNGKAAICSFDMLGEGARTAKDADKYFAAYKNAIMVLSEITDPASLPEKKHGISVKLSALHPRYEALKHERLFDELYPKLFDLAKMAAEANINLTIDAEEADRLVISLKMLDRLANEEVLGDWQGLGLAVQAYQKRSLAVVDNLTNLARNCRGGKGRRLMVRLVKGAYWDSEIKHAQIGGVEDFPVWTRKANTDICYLACARKLLDAGRWIYSQFATHNANTIAAIEEMVKGGRNYEFQRLHGMGEALYMAVYDEPERPRPCRVYAPVGEHEDLLPYLVRRLLENGANTSFVHSFLNEDVPPEVVARSPFDNLPLSRHDKIPRPSELFAPSRKNSQGFDITQTGNADMLQQAVSDIKRIKAGLVIGGEIDKKSKKKTNKKIYSPQNGEVVGTCKFADSSLTKESNLYINKTVKLANQAFDNWNNTPVGKRAEILGKCADLLEEKRMFFIGLMAKEAGKCFADAIAEVREAVDFLRYYAAEAERIFIRKKLPSPAGETNHLSLHGRGVFVCISPWNFPLAIFTGQIAAALVTGNTVIAKPAEQTPLVGFEMVKLMYKAGLPENVLHFLPGKGAKTGAALVAHKDIAGVCFTGSTEVANIINLSLAKKTGEIPVLIAETGGINGMFVDTSALGEQIVDDVIYSAFNAAGQRCSALRVLFLPEHTADGIIEMLKGAMDELDIGDPAIAKTDIGPVIDEKAKSRLLTHIEHMNVEAKILHMTDFPKNGSFVPPTLIELPNLDLLEREVFGPILHIIRYSHKNLTDLARQFAATKYGLTLGVHSRIDGFAEHIARLVPAGNVYVNRNMIGAVVGVQPFGGLGLSGTGPKAGGPNYLHRFTHERTTTINISAQGGDPALLNLAD